MTSVADDVIGVLRGPFCNFIRFQAEGLMGPIVVGPSAFRQVADAIHGHRIHVVENRHLSSPGAARPLYGRYFSYAGTLGGGSVGANTLVVAPAGQIGSLMREAAVAHESFHAWLDLNHRRLTRADNEAVGQIVSGVYLMLGSFTFRPPFGTILAPIARAALDKGIVSARAMSTLRQYLIDQGYAGGGLVEGNHLTIYHGNG